MIGADLIDILAPAVAVGLLTAAVHAPFGIEVLRRGIVFIDLATAQVVALGILVAKAALHGLSWEAEQAAVFASAILAALFFRGVERRLPREQEAVIGSTFVVAASAALIAVADDPHGGEALRSVLAGQILFVTWGDMLAFLPVYAAVAVAWIAIPRARDGFAFFVLFAVTVSASVQLVGVYVVFASLILPALAANGGPGRRGRASASADRAPVGTDRGRGVFLPRLARAWVCGGLSVAAGVMLSALLDLPAGPVLVVCYAASAAAMRVVWRGN
ncbi:MAG: metal ABC transporter permease [Rhodospirillaceae bacterium]